MKKVSSSGLKSLCGLLLIALALPSTARVKLGGGMLTAIKGQTGRVALLSWLTGERWQTELGLGYLIRNRSQRRPRSEEFNYVSAGRRLQPLSEQGFFGGLSVAFLTEQSDALTSRGQFVSSMGWSGRRCTLAAQHISNAHTGGRNRGENMLTVSYAW